jgi:hypothetical protein
MDGKYGIIELNHTPLSRFPLSKSQRDRFFALAEECGLPSPSSGNESSDSAIALLRGFLIVPKSLED